MQLSGIEPVKSEPKTCQLKIRLDIVAKVKCYNIDNLHIFNHYL